MKRQSFWKISVVTTPEAEDAVAEMLAGIFNCAMASYFDVETGTSAVSIFISENKISPPKIRAAIRKELQRIKDCGLKIGAGKISISKLRRENWAESWKRHFKSIEIGNLLVKPSWSKRSLRKNQAVVILDPGLSFGTGQHPTTSFCLREIVAAVCDRRNQRSQSAATTKSFLDIGTGSGILAIAAAKLGYRPVRAIDFDAEAVRIAQGNAGANGVWDKIKIVRADVAKFQSQPKKQFDLVCANLISNLLIAERKKIAAQLNRDGTLVLAGILDSEFQEVRREFEKLGLKLISSKTESKWRSGSFSFA